MSISKTVEAKMRTPDRDELTFGSNDPQNEEKLRELVLYVIQKCGDDPRFGATKLNKILFYSDFYSYAHFGKPITGVEYMKLPQGPAPRRLVPVRSLLVKAGDLEIFEKPLFTGKTQTRFVAKRLPDLRPFSGPELALVDEIIDYLRDKSAGEVSDATHGRAWKVACDRDSIPYESVFLSDRAANASDTALVRKFARKFNWKQRAAENGSSEGVAKRRASTVAGR